MTLRHVALTSLAHAAEASLFSVKLRLAPLVHAKGKEKTSEIDWLRERITKHLKDELGGVPSFQMVLTSDVDGGLLLGEIAMPLKQRDKARVAFLKVGGQLAASTSKKVLWIYHGPDCGWTNMMIRGLPRTGLPPICANRVVDQEAQRIYEQEWLPLIKGLRDVTKVIGR